MQNGNPFCLGFNVLSHHDELYRYLNVLSPLLYDVHIPAPPSKDAYRIRCGVRRLHQPAVAGHEERPHVAVLWAGNHAVELRCMQALLQ